MKDQAPTSEGSVEALLGQVADEFTERWKRGEWPDVEEYARRYPEMADLLRQVLPAVQVMGADSLGSASVIGGSEDLRPIPGCLGDFRILREVGRGGMGVVYEAEQISLQRRVALKLLPFAATMDPRQLQRFGNEARAAASLQHSHIVPVHAVGCERGIHYYAMQFVDGQTLEALIRQLRAGTDEPRDQDQADGRESPISSFAGAVTEPQAQGPTQRSVQEPAHFRRVAEWGLQAAEALEHAHALGIVHRDVKPANLLVDAQGGLWVTDFGLARTAADTGLTMTGDVLGTLRYMSPEQALAKHGVVDHRTDVYSLGVTLYELLTLRPAVGGTDRQEIQQQLASAEPVPPRRVNRAVPAELETIILKAMAKNPDERYTTAQELADDLRRWLDDKPIRARRPTLRQRAAKWARRHRTVLRAAVVVFLLAVVGLAVGTALVWQAKNELGETLERERQLREQERRNAYFQRIALAEREWAANDLSRMQQLLEECPPDLRGWEWHYLNRLRYKPLPPLRHEGAVLSAAFSPDGRRIASSDKDGWVKVWDAPAGQPLLEFKAHDTQVRSVAFSPDGRRLATGSDDRIVKTWDAQTGQYLGVCKHHNGDLQRVEFSRDGRYLVSASTKARDEGVMVWDADTGNDVLTLRGLRGASEGPSGANFALSPDGKRLAAAAQAPGGEGLAITVWDLQTGQTQLTLRGHTASTARGLAFSPDGRLLASGSGETFRNSAAELKVWDTQTGQELLSLRGHTAMLSGVAFSPDGRRLASASVDQTVKLWDVPTGQEVLTLRGHSGTVWEVAFSPDGHRLISTSADGAVRIWDGRPAEGELDPGCLTLPGHASAVKTVAFHPKDPRVLASAGTDGTVRLWDAWSGKQLRGLPHARDVGGVAFSPHGQRFASADGWSVRLWDVTTGREIIPPSPLETRSNVPSLAYSPDGRLLAAGAYARKPLIIWDAATGEPIHNLPNTWVVWGVVFSPDSKRIASANNDGTVRVWDVTTGEEVCPPLRHEAGTTSVDFSPDGRWLASAGMDRTVTVWHTTTWEPRLVLRDPTGVVQCVAFSPDGKRLAWGGSDATVKVANATTGRILETFRGHTGWVNSVAFNSDGKQIASASADGTVKVWKAPPVAEAPGRQAGNQDR